MAFENLKEWNVWWTRENFDELSGIDRDKTSELFRLISSRHIKILAGIRRSGKSTILYQIIKKLIQSGVQPKNILFLNMEDEALLEADFDKLVSIYLENIAPEGDIYLFIDEIQNRERWEFWVKTQYDLKKFKQIFISGSSSSLLLSKHASLLTGRQFSFLVYPLSFSEFLKFKKIDYDINLITKEQKAKIKALLKEYIAYGGFPEAVLEKEKHRILVEYYSSIIERDIVVKYGLDEKKVKDLCRYLISNISSPHSYKKLASLAGLSPTTVISYLSHIEESYLFSQLLAFSYKIKDQLQYPRKVYCHDTGLVNSIAFQFGPNITKLYENLAFLELKRRGNEIFYWRSFQHEEVDFVVKEGLKIKQLIQVCYNLNEADTKKRELKSLFKAGKELKCNNALIITEDKEGKETLQGMKIEYIPLWKWLLRG